MADLSDIQTAKTVKVVGADATGVETNTLTVHSNNAISALPPIANSGHAVGELFTTNASPAAGEKVLKTAYTEQKTNAQRSISSASANDTSAGTGARTVTITYLDQTGAGPFTETVTLNGTSWVNTTNSNICFIESIVVATVGSGLSNAGIITLKAATGGGGATIATIAAGDNRTKWAQHYVPDGKTCYISDWHGAAQLNAATGGALTWMSVTPLGSYERFITARLRYVGSIGSLLVTYLTPIPITGPAKINVYIVSASTADNNHYAEFNYFEL